MALEPGPGRGSREEPTSTPIYLPPFRIDVSVGPAISLPVARSRLAGAIRFALVTCEAPSPASIGLILTDDNELARLNEEHMGHAGPTDVLSFPLLPPGSFPPHPGSGARGAGPRPAAFALPPRSRVHLGDVVISVERAIAQAEGGGGGQTGNVRWTAAEELLLLAVHGTLHVCGWDHAEPAEEAAMRAREMRVLAALRAVS